MTEEKTKEYILDCIDLYVNEKTALEIALCIINQLSDEFYESGNITDSNTLNTCYLCIKEILEKED